MIEMFFVNKEEWAVKTIPIPITGDLFKSLEIHQFLQYVKFCDYA